MSRAAVPLCVAMLSVHLCVDVALADLSFDRPTMPELAATNALVCAGRVVALDLVGARPRILVATVVIDHLVKGSAPGKSITVAMDEVPDDFVLSHEDRQRAAGRYLMFLNPLPISTGMYRLLKVSNAMTRIASESGGTMRGLAPAEQVRGELLQALYGEDESTALTAMQLLREGYRHDTEFEKALLGLAQGGGKALQGKALAELILRGRYSVLTLVETYAGPEEVLNEVGYALSTIYAPDMIPDLVRLASTGPIHVRRGAMASLRSMATRDRANVLKPVFQTALDDTDLDVVYDALMGLGSIEYGISASMQHVNLAPSTVVKPLPARDLFDKDPRKYIRAWKDVPR